MAYQVTLSQASKYLTLNTHAHTHTHTRLTALFSRTTRVNRYQKGKTNLDFTEARDSEWQWHQLGHMQVYTLAPDRQPRQYPPLKFFTGRPTNSVKALNTYVQMIISN